MTTIQNFLGSEEYSNFIENDSSFPMDENSVKNIIEYLSAKYPDEMIDENFEHAQSEICYFANNWINCKAEIDIAEEKDNDYDNVNLNWDYPVAKQMYIWINESNNIKFEIGLTHDEDDEQWFVQLKGNLNVWLSLLKISLTNDPFDESLKYNDDAELLVPRLTADKQQVGFYFEEDEAYENIQTREETLLFLIHQMGEIYKERGNLKGYNKWVEHCRIYLQSVLTMPLLPPAPI